MFEILVIAYGIVWILVSLYFSRETFGDQTDTERVLYSVIAGFFWPIYALIAIIAEAPEMLFLLSV